MSTVVSVLRLHLEPQVNAVSDKLTAPSGPKKELCSVKYKLFGPMVCHMSLLKHCLIVILYVHKRQTCNAIQYPLCFYDYSPGNPFSFN